MTRNKKCDDCGTILTAGNKNRIKTRGHYGEGKSVVKDEGRHKWKESPTIIYLCNECYKFHISVVGGNEEGEITEGSPLDKILAKHSYASNWKKAREMELIWKQITTGEEKENGEKKDGNKSTK